MYTDFTRSKTLIVPICVCSLNTLALAVFTRSPAAYEALKSFKLLQLPSVRTLKYYIDANLEGAGDCMNRLEDERRHYLLMLEKKKTDLEQKKLLQQGRHTLWFRKFCVLYV